MTPVPAVLLLTAILALPGAAFAAPAAGEGGAEDLRDRLDRFLAGAAVNDAAIHDAFWAEELVYTSSGGTRFGKAELMAGVRESGPVAVEDAASRYSAEEVRIRRFGELALLDFVLVATARDGTRARYLNSGVFVRRDGRWQAVNWHATRSAGDG